MRRTVGLGLVAVLAVWVAGVALTGLGGAPAAHAQDAGIKLRKAHAGFAPSLDGSKPIVILAIGSGARPGDDVEHSLADSLHVIFLNPKSHRATLVGIPRDSYVPIPGHGTDKINSSMFYGGPQLLVQTIEQYGGIRIDYFALTTFWGFTAMIDDIGGLTVDVPFPMNDSYSRADFAAGPQELNGHEALAFSRDRHSLNSGDFGRQENGGRLFLAALTQFREQFDEDQGALLTWIGAGMRNVDTDLSVDEVLALAYTASHVSPKHVENVVLPGGTAMISGKSVVTLDHAAASRIFGDAKNDGSVSKKNLPPSPTANQS